MSPCIITTIIFIFFLLPLSISSQPSSLIEKTCTATTYHDFCVSSLSSASSSSSQTLNPTTKFLSTTIINIAIANATNASSLASSLAAEAKNPALASLLRTCAEKYVHAKESLNYSLDAILSEDYDYASLHVSAAAEYPNVCRALFRQGAPPVVYPVEMARREEVMERLCSVALDIISLLG